MSISELWTLLRRYEGEEFYTKRGLPFRYEVASQHVIIERAGKKYLAQRSDFEFGLDHPNEERTVYCNNMHRVSSYVIGILSDARFGAM